MEDEECFLRDYIHCTKATRPIFSNVGIARLRAASERREDNLLYKLDDTKGTYRCHKDCISTYTSKTHLKRLQENPEDEAPIKRARRSLEKTFNFKVHCLFCGEECQFLDPKNPGRHEKIVLCQTTDRQGLPSFKRIILEECDARGDDLGEKVRSRILQAVSDLPAADARYHQRCRLSFRNIPLNPSSIKSCDEAFNHVTNRILEDKTKIWNSVLIEELYKSYGGTELSRRALIDKLSETIPDILILSGNGIASIVIFKKHATIELKTAFIDKNDDDELHSAVRKVAKQINSECSKLKWDNNTYEKRISLEECLKVCSPTLINLLGHISTKLDKTLSSAMIGNIITSTVARIPTTLQIALSLEVKGAHTIEMLHSFGVTSTYDEMRRFKSSAAQEACNKIKHQGIKNSEAGLIQVVADNFDTTISSPNGLKQSHLLAMIVTQPDNPQICDEWSDKKQFRRLKKYEMSNTLPEIPVHEYTGPKKPDMPANKALSTPMPLKVLTQEVLSFKKASEIGFQFMKDIATIPGTPEFGGYNTKIARENKLPVKPKSQTVYLPLIDMKPAEPSTMLTAMIESQRVTKEAGQVVTVFTTDQQLYKVTVNVDWVYQDRFFNFFPRLGPMHFEMSFVGALCTLMTESGLVEILESSFGGVLSMITGKKYPQNVRALRIVVEELLKKVITNEPIESHTQLMDFLEKSSQKSLTTKLWVDVLIKGVFLLMNFQKAEREGNFPLHRYCSLRMLPYFFAAGHVNYARYGLYYVRSFGNLPDSVLRKFLDGEHVMRHKSGIWNGIGSDQFIESTYMRYGHGPAPAGVIGNTLDPAVTKTWAMSLHTCTRLRNDLFAMAKKDNDPVVLNHKEEGSSRIRSDTEDRLNIRRKLESCVDPLDPSTHPPKLMNVVNGRLHSNQVNVYNAVELGKVAMTKFNDGWPQSFNQTLSSTVHLMTKRYAKTYKPEFHQSLIYGRVLGIHGVRDMPMDNVMSHELDISPQSMFDEKTRSMRIPTSKATLKKCLQVEVSSRNESEPDVILLDGCAILWIVKWPKKGTVQDYVSNFKNYIQKELEKSSVYLIFDRYIKRSTKEATRLQRAGKHASRGHKLQLSSPLPQQQVLLNVSENKCQLINIICQYFLDNPICSNKSLVVTGPDTPIEYNNGLIIHREDLKTSHEEADVIIVNQVSMLSEIGLNSIGVVADDTDIFVLLLHAVHRENIKCDIILFPTTPSRAHIDIQATARAHKDILGNLLQAHALTGCDTVSNLYGIGKSTMVSVLKSGISVTDLGSLDKPIESITSQSKSFIAACYGCPDATDMTDARIKVWKKKMGNKKLNAAPELKVLPPTREAFGCHVKRAQLQALVWRSYKSMDPPNLNPEDYGWKFDEDEEMLLPIPLPDNVDPAPQDILKLIKCGCDSCSTTRCSCLIANLSCSMFCKCHDNQCNNPNTKSMLNPPTDDNEENIEPLLLE